MARAKTEVVRTFAWAIITPSRSQWPRQEHIIMLGTAAAFLIAPASKSSNEKLLSKDSAITFDNTTLPGNVDCGGSRNYKNLHHKQRNQHFQNHLGIKVHKNIHKNRKASLLLHSFASCW